MSRQIGCLGRRVDCDVSRACSLDPEQFDHHSAFRAPAVERRRVALPVDHANVNDGFEKKRGRDIRSEGVDAYFGELEKLSRADLDRSAQESAAREKERTARLIAHIAEIKSRKDLVVEYGYSSLFDYCVRRLNLGQGAVWRRLQVASVCQRFPQILVALFENRLNLTAASVLAPHLTDDNVDRLLSEAEGKSKCELRELVVALSPKEEFAPSVRKIPRAEKTEAPLPVGQDPVLSAERPPEPQPIVEAATDKSYNFRFCSSKEFKAKFARLAEVVGVEDPHRYIEAVLETALEIALDRRDPRRKLERRRKREAKASREGGFGAHDVRNRSLPGVQTADPSERTTARVAPPRPGKAVEGVTRDVSRYIPSAVCERVFDRAGYRCEFHGPDGTRCQQRTGLEIDHVKPFALFRDHDERYLRVLCGRHNRFSAEQVYGTEFIRGKIAERQRRRAPADEQHQASSEVSRRQQVCKT